MSRNINRAGGGSRSRGGGGDEAAAAGFRVSIPANVRSIIQSIRETTGKQHSDEEIYSVLQDRSMDPNETAQKLLYLAGFRVSIPANIRSIIQSIRETTGKQHSDEEIYSVLQDCSMDPNETAQKLLYLDTFHEVKKKRERRKEVQGARVGRGNYYSNSNSDGRSGRNSASRRENGVGPGSRRAISNAVPHEKKVSAAVPNGPSSLHIGSINHVPDSKMPVDGVLPEPKIDVAVDAKKSLTAPQHPAPTFASVMRAEKENLAPISNPVTSSAKNPTTCGIVSQQKGVESNDAQGNKTITSDMDMKLLMGGKVLNASNSILKEEAKSNSEVVNNNQSTEPLQSAPLLTHDSSLFVHSSNNDGQLSQGSAPPPTGSATVLKKATLPEAVVPDGQNVTFPNHFKVLEAVKSGLVFGSISAGSGLTSKYVNGTIVETNSSSAIESSHTNDESAEEPLTSGQSVSSTGQTQSHDNLQSSPLLDEVPSLADHISTSTNLKQDEPKQEMPLLSGGHQKPHVQNVPNYGIGLLLPTSPGGQLAPMEGPETQAPDVSQISNFVNGNSLAPSTSPAPVQSSAAATPQPPLHLFRQPYPSFLPYGQYLPPYIMPQIPHQFLTPNGLPQQSSTGNLYLQSAAAAAAAVAAGVKFPLSQFKPAANASSPAHMGIPSGFGSYGSSPIGFNPLTAGSSGKSSSNEDIATSQLKDNHVYTTGPLSEGLGVWMAAPGQDLSNIQMNPLYNLNLHGPPLTFAPPHTGQGPFPGIYQPPQTVTPPSNINPLLQQSQPLAAAAAEQVGPPSGAYQQQQPPQIAQMNWNRSY